MPAPVRFLPGALVVLVALLASGCASGPAPVVTRLPTDGTPAGISTPTATATAAPTPQASVSATAMPVDPPDDATDCGGGEQTITGSSPSFVLVGDCPILTIEGNALTVDASGATVGALTISGDRIDVQASSLGETTVQGNDITVEASSLGSLTVRGDRNTVSASGGSGAVVISGNDNVVTARSSDVTDDGQRNRVG